MLKNKKHSSFVFTHIPKCGGTSFREYLNDSSEKSGISVSSRYIPGFNGLENEKNIPQLNDIELEKLRSRDLKLIACHSKYDVHKTYELSKITSPFYYTILREPLARFVSHYYFFYYKHNNADCKGIHLNDLSKAKLESIVDNLSNIQAKWICNKNIVTLDEAVVQLKDYYGCFGMLEYLKESIEILDTYKPSWLTILNDMPFSNSNKGYDLSSIDDDILELFQSYNSIDNELYMKAKHIFIKRYLLL